MTQSGNRKVLMAGGVCRKGMVEEEPDHTCCPCAELRLKCDTLEVSNWEKGGLQFIFKGISLAVVF
jgi:hypothetical protein